MWVRVVESKYGEKWRTVGELVVDGVRRRWSNWWKDILRVTLGVDEELDGNLRR